ncbi:hypothetical protein A5756_17195 [Mycobacterium sp. 852002-53434_SCH5985345]|uniref:hypothetical protein n=1 Tax=unclassified Mycobacterium TaxID=2642494 RepID=UPI0007FFD67B|nr:MULTISPECIES: hypothetical protein [unclassified Mycobacterium]OBF52775.1 hypothetical protein A5756_17195 [Mycobacterium sp. 852002-53434_SCH5985345]OBF91743.1 hypothetical protein A5773_22720 [Mycobacterium sp. 852014-52450_SCH5900713]
MTTRAHLIFSVAVVALTAGLFALRFPVFIDAYDQYGWQVKCGSGFTTDLTQASGAVNGPDHVASSTGAPGTNYVARCDDALMIRRAWAIPTAALGGLTLTWLAAMALARDRRHTGVGSHHQNA